MSNVKKAIIYQKLGVCWAEAVQGGNTKYRIYNKMATTNTTTAWNKTWTQVVEKYKECSSDTCDVSTCTKSHEIQANCQTGPDATTYHTMGIVYTGVTSVSGAVAAATAAAGGGKASGADRFGLAAGAWLGLLAAWTARA